MFKVSCLISKRSLWMDWKNQNLAWNQSNNWTPASN